MGTKNSYLAKTITENMIFGFDKPGLIKHNLLTLLEMAVNGSRNAEIAKKAVEINQSLRGFN